MGYESKLIIVDHYEYPIEDSGNSWAEVISIINLCKAGIPVSEFFRESNCYIYFDGDGNTQVTEDMYGDQLTECTDVAGLLNWLKAQYAESEYRRFAVAIALIEACYNQKWKNLKVLHYGY
mgnify:CR=1 FL=1